MAIYNINNIRSINEDKSDIARYDATAKDRARRRSKEGKEYNTTGIIPPYLSKKEQGKSYKQFMREIEDMGRRRYNANQLKIKAPSTSIEDSMSIRSSFYRPHNDNGLKGEKLMKQAANLNRSLTNATSFKNTDIDKARIERKLKESKAKQAKLKEAAQYILDVLDEQEYYDEYDNSNDYYYYE